MKRTRDITQGTMCWITSLPEDMIQRIVNFLGYCDTRSLNQTCKLLNQCILYEHLPHKCVPPSIQKISHCDDLERLKNGELIRSESEGLILDEMPLDSELINLIRDYCPKLKYLFIKYSCKCDVLMLDFENLPCVGISIKINMFDMDCSLSICNLSSTVESFTAHISGIDPVTLKTIPGKYERRIYLNINNLENLKSL
jgi:hypothetical protein